MLDIRDTQGHFGQRGVNDIIISCFATIFACTWSAVHPNIPAVTDSPWTCFKRQVTITICALLAPELMTLWAMNQRVGAQKIMDEYNKDISGLPESDRRKRSFLETIRGWFDAVFVAICGVFQDLPLPPRFKDDKAGPRWTLAHGFLLQMGGFMLCEYGQPTQILKHVSQMREKVDPPRISEEDIKDRSKGDTISKTFIVLQTTWFIVQCIARWSQHLSITELEVVTLAFAMLNGITYGLWWHKPQNVGRPVFLESKSRERPNVNPALISTAVISASEAESESNSLLRYTNAGKESFLRRKLHKEIENHARSPKLLWRLPYRILQALFRHFGKMIDSVDTETEMRVGMFYAGYTVDDGQETLYAIVAIGTLFGAIHLIPSWFLTFPSCQEMWLWRISAIIITIDPILTMSGAWFDIHGYEMLSSILRVLMLIGLPLYPISRIILLTLSLTALRSLPSAALQTIEWTTFIPHL